MSFSFDSQPVDLPCPKCGHKSKQSIGWLKANDSMTCPGCGARFNLDKTNFDQPIRQVERKVNDAFAAIGRSWGKRR